MERVPRFSSRRPQLGATGLLARVAAVLLPATILARRQPR